jgi:hypothetical protein
LGARCRWSGLFDHKEQPLEHNFRLPAAASKPGKLTGQRTENPRLGRSIPPLATILSGHRKLSPCITSKVWRATRTVDNFVVVTLCAQNDLAGSLDLDSLNLANQLTRLGCTVANMPGSGAIRGRNGQLYAANLICNAQASFSSRSGLAASIFAATGLFSAA